jgi:signal peptidase I
MTKKNTPAVKKTSEEEIPAAETQVEETPLEALASICGVLVVGLYILTFLAQNFVIPSGSMEKTLLVGDHLVVDRITLAPKASWMPLERYREPKRNDIVVFIKPLADDVDGKPQYLFLVKRLIGVPGDHIHLRNGTVYINGEPQVQPHAEATTVENHQDFLDEFPSVAPYPQQGGATDSWAVEFPSHIENGDLVVPPGKYFMMGDHRHNSLDSRFWGFVPRENIVGRPLFNYWSFKTPEDEYNKSGLGHTVAWIAHVAVRMIPDTRWSRTLHVVR